MHVDSRNISSRFSKCYEANASEHFENLEEIILLIVVECMDMVTSLTRMQMVKMYENNVSRFLKILKHYLKYESLVCTSNMCHSIKHSSSVNHEPYQEN